MQKYWPLAFLLGIIWVLPGCFKTENKITNRDTATVDSLITIYRDSLHSNPMAAIKAVAAMREDIKDPIESYRLLQFIANCYNMVNIPDSVISINRRLIGYCERTPSTPRLSSLKTYLYNDYGIFWEMAGQWDSATWYYKKAYDLLAASGQPDKLPDICMNLASCYQQSSNYPQSSYYFRRALFVADSLGEGARYHLPIFSGMARLYVDLDNFTLADQYFSQAESDWKKAPAYERYHFANSRGNYYYDVKDYPQALEWFRKADTIVKTFPQPLYQGIVEGNMGEIFLLMEQPDSARYYLDRAKTFLGQVYEQPSFKFYMNGLYASLALLENNLSAAEKILLQPYDSTMISPLYVYSHNRRLEKLFAGKNDFKSAYKYRLKVDTYNDSLRNTKVRNNIAEIDMRYKQDTTLLRKDLRIALVEGHASQWQNIALMSLLTLVLITALAVAFILYSRRKKEQDYRKQLATVTGLRMEIVRNRLSPHFMFNALNAVMPALNRHEELERPFRLLIQLLRGNLHASEQIAIPVKEEIELVNDYLRLQMLGNSQTIRIEWEVSDDVLVDTRIPSMSIQIPVENAVKYAFESIQTDACIAIRVAKQADMIYITIDDNGVGYNLAPGAFNERGTGNGLKMLHRTVELLNLRNTNKMIFKIENKQQLAPDNHGTQVTVIVPIDYHFEM